MKITPRNKTIVIVGTIARTNWNNRGRSTLVIEDESGKEHEIVVDHKRFMPIVNRAGYSLATLNHPTRLSEEGKNVRHGPNGDHAQFESIRQRNMKILGAIRSYKKPTIFKCIEMEGELVLEDSTVRGTEA